MTVSGAAAIEVTAERRQYPSYWSSVIDTASSALRGLDAAGTLEVAYGGGEPFAFRGFAKLVAEIDATTALAGT